MDASLASERADWLEKMEPITPRSYLCRYTAKPIIVDGSLDDAAWASAPWTQDFTDICGAAKPKPRFRTRAKLLWDDNYLYVGAELEEPHVWATLTKHDSVIFEDPDFEVFIDPKGETQPYYELEINALNTTWDLLLNKPYLDGGQAHNEWEIPGAKTAVRVRGTLNQDTDTDRGWTVEIALPWKVLSEHARQPGPPQEGEQWRMDFSRVEWQIAHTNGIYRKVPSVPEDNWVWSAPGVVDMHRPEMWGVVQFTRQPPGKKASVGALPGKSARDRAIEIYYAQRDFWSAHYHYAAGLHELGCDQLPLPAGVQPPVLQATADGYNCTVGFMEGDRQRTWRIRQDRLLKLDEPMPVDTEVFVTQAAEKFGEIGRRAAYFLVDNMPPADRATLGADFLMENLALALEARQKFPWAKSYPERMFFNDVLPYASLDEPRDAWRAQFYKLSSEIVGDCTNATQAAQALNRELFNRIKVHYNTRRKRNNQSPAESIAQGKATCTGLAIILVDACRSVGVPARIAGVPLWSNKEGNHTWTEIWDGQWFFTGADEYDKQGFNRAWFNNDAAITVRGTNRLNQIFASSWRRTGDYFPLAWDLDSRDVPAVNVSTRYVGPETKTNPVPLSADPPSAQGTKQDQMPTREDAELLIASAWAQVREKRTEAAAAELAAKQIVLGEHTLQWLEQTSGERLDGKHSLWITLHGGGQGTAEENDRNWRGYFGRYEFPPGAINVAPRAPANTWDMWHVAWVDDLLDRLIADFVMQRGVDPTHVYLIGYSAGGDGVYQLAPRMSDRFAAAAMCAGHPNAVTPEGLRNLPFFLYMGGDDAAYNRNVVVREFSARMDALEAQDKAGYPHRLTVFAGMPHSMSNREAEAIPRMTVLSRQPWPKRVVWKQDDVTHTRFYWLERPSEAVKAYEIYAAHVEGQTITIETPATGGLTLRLSDKLLDLDQPVRVQSGGRTIYEGKACRSAAAIAQSLREREDADTIATALLPVSW